MPSVSAVYSMGNKSASSVPVKSAENLSAAEVEKEIARISNAVKERDPEQKEFLQAVDEVIETLKPLLKAEPKYLPALETLVEPERVIQFRVPWLDQEGRLNVNRAFRVQFSSAIGPFKGGLRLHPTVNLSVLKFLGFEQILKNSLTGLAMGGGKGGSDFDPKGKSDFEVRAFCQAFMAELQRHIGADTDVPAGDIGVGAREIGFMYGQYRKLRNESVGVLTGKGMSYGGSLVRPEATGYGAVYYAVHMLKDMGKELKDMTVLVSGAGNAAQYTCEKLIELGAKVLTVSDSNGVAYYPDGMTKQQLQDIMVLKNEKRGRLSELKHGGEYMKDTSVFSSGIKADLAFPSATQNEIDEAGARQIADKGVIAVVEVANMPSTKEAIAVYRERKIRFAPAKAANAGGVAVSGLEMAQNAARHARGFDEVDAELKQIMEHIYNECTSYAKQYATEGDLQSGANIAGFVKVADALLAQGLF